MTDDAVEIVARAISPMIRVSAEMPIWSAKAEAALAALREAGYVIVPAATIAQRDATIERLRGALKPFADFVKANPLRGHQDGSVVATISSFVDTPCITLGDLRAARAAYDGTGDVQP